MLTLFPFSFRLFKVPPRVGQNFARVKKSQTDCLGDKVVPESVFFSNKRMSSVNLPTSGT